MTGCQRFWPTSASCWNCFRNWVEPAAGRGGTRGARPPGHDAAWSRQRRIGSEHGCRGRRLMICTRGDIIGPGELDVGASQASDELKSINFRVHTLASSLFKGATQYYGARFGVGLPEMRVLSNLGSEGPLAAHQIVALTAMDKALVSRVLTMLNRRQLVRSSARKSDPRRRTWSLTCAGRDL